MKIIEYRGVSNLVYAPVIQDDADAYITGTVKPFAGVAEISKTVETSNEVHYYDNKAAVPMNAAGVDEVTCSVSAIPLDVLADIGGEDYDNGTLIEGQGNPQYFALGYQLKATDGSLIYVWRYKGTFNVPDMTATTEDDGTDASGQEVTFTGVSTIHRFWTTDKTAKGLIVDVSLGKADVSTFFDDVTTPDMLRAIDAPILENVAYYVDDEGNSAQVLSDAGPVVYEYI